MEENKEELQQPQDDKIMVIEVKTYLNKEGKLSATANFNADVFDNDRIQAFLDESVERLYACGKNEETKEEEPINE